MASLRSDTVDHIYEKHQEWAEKILADVSDVMSIERSIASDATKAYVQKMIKEAVPERKDTLGTKEGDICGRDGCEGVLTHSAEEGCSCHINPPCSACVEAPLRCPECGWTEEEK